MCHVIIRVTIQQQDIISFNRSYKIRVRTLIFDVHNAFMILKRINKNEQHFFVN